MAVAMAHAQPQLAKKAPEQSHARPVTHHPFETPFSGGTDLGTILYLQRTAGNAAVTVPVYGVPVKVGEGAAVKLPREGHDSKKYNVTESGEGLIAVTAPKAGGEGPGKAPSMHTGRCRSRRLTP